MKYIIILEDGTVYKKDELDETLLEFSKRGYCTIIDLTTMRWLENSTDKSEWNEIPEYNF